VSINASLGFLNWIFHVVSGMELLLWVGLGSFGESYYR
jgi:hypothetical protein